MTKSLSSHPVQGIVYSSRFNPSGSILASSSFDQTIRESLLLISS